MEAEEKNCLQIHQKTVRFIDKTHMGDSPCSKPYKTCRILIILEPKTQNGLQNNQKSIRFSTKSLWRFTTSRNVEKALVLEHFGATEKLIKLPYITCRTLIILEPQTQNGFQNDQKSIRFLTINHMAIHHVENPYKTCRNLIILEPETQNGLQNDQKALGFPPKVDDVLRLRKILKKHWS